VFLSGLLFSNLTDKGTLYFKDYEKRSRQNLSDDGFPITNQLFHACAVGPPNVSGKTGPDPLTSLITP